MASTSHSPMQICHLVEMKAWIRGSLKSCSRLQTDHHVLISLQILLLLLCINHPFVHLVESTQYFNTFVTEFGSTYPLLTILVSFLSGKKCRIIQTTCTHLVRYMIDNNYYYFILINIYHPYLNHLHSLKWFAI